MIISFPFVADSNRIIGFPFVNEGISHYEDINPVEGEVNMKIWAHDGIDTSIAIAAELDDVYFRIVSSNSIAVGPITTNIDLYESAMRIAASNADASLAINVSGHSEMIIRSSSLEAEMLIDLTQDALLQAWMRIHADELATHSDVRPEPDSAGAGFYIKVHGDTVVGPISASLGDIQRLAMRISESQGELHTAIKLLDDEEGRTKVIIRAEDDVGTVRGIPLTIGYLDEMTIGQLDPDKVPDFIYITD